MSLLHTDPPFKTIFPQCCFSSVFRSESLKELLAPSLCPNKKVARTNSISICNKCDTCNNYVFCYKIILCSVTNRKSYTRGVLHCNCSNVIYLITCKNGLERYVGSAINFFMTKVSII